MRERFVLRGNYIQLDQLLKVQGLVMSGGEAHTAIDAGELKVDGKREIRRRAKLRAGQVVTWGEHCIEITGAAD